LKAEERKRFELDVREQGSFQHEILARFHQQLRSEDKRWRDISPSEARDRIGRIATDLISTYREGLFQATEQSQFAAASLKLALQQFIETVVGWMGQYQFDPWAVELAFGIEEKPLPAWEIDLGEGHRLSFRGKIDRIDLWPVPGTDEAHCIVIDYKSSARRLDVILMAHGVQLQLPAYLNVLRSLPEPERVFGVRRLLPAGVFFVNLRGDYEGAKTRQEVLEGVEDARKSAYRHSGRFDAEILRKLDNRTDATVGDQFSYRLTSKGKVHGGCREVMNEEEFAAMLDMVEVHLRRMGQEIFQGVVKVDPYRKGTSEVACDKCHYQSICRIDPWTHSFRILKKPEAAP
jgi:ATP-dependent helicase/nuclease subunit B